MKLPPKTQEYINKLAEEIIDMYELKDADVTAAVHRHLDSCPRAVLIAMILSLADKPKLN